MQVQHKDAAAVEPKDPRIAAAEAAAVASQPLAESKIGNPDKPLGVDVSKPQKLPELHLRIRQELDPEEELISDDQIAEIMYSIGTIPYRVVTRVLLVMEDEAKKKEDWDLVCRVRLLKMRFSDGLLKLNKLQHAGRC